jgi:hypothetical protein
MINRCIKTSCLVFLMCFSFAGCQQQKKENTLVYQRLTDPNFVIVDYASAAIEATGGSQAWAGAKKLQFDCVVTMYALDGSFYLTEHHYEICPLSNSIRVSAQEPLKKLVWQLSEGRLRIIKGAKQNDISSAEDFYHDFAELILMITTAPVRFLDKHVVFAKASAPVKMKGLWYEPIQRTISFNDVQSGLTSPKPYWSEVVFYQNNENSLVDTIWFASRNKKNFLSVHGYDYTVVDKKGVLIPAKIEISRTDARGTLLNRLAEINFK